MNTDIPLWLNILINVLTTFAGATLGVGLALYANQQASESRRKEREQHLLKSIQSTLEEAITSLDAAIDSQRRPLSLRVNTSVLESTSSAKYEIIDDIALNRKLDNILSMLDYTSKLTHTLHNAVIIPAGIDPHSTPRKIIEILIEDSAKKALPFIEEALDEIKKKLESPDT